ncbi:hypothetical protein COO60DRAFT_1613218 [Scenedesmus sp. NREL 46B-D3]|nr:hypothetical protein COO60DRAFT_1613218 [Scenedesmus sp. NREL 46B-D3]
MMLKQQLRPFSTRQARPSSRHVCVCRAAASTTAAALPSEAEAVAAYKAGTADGLQPCLALLKKAATDKSVQPQLVEGALAYLEQSHPKPAADIDGSWRLEDFVIQLGSKQCALESVVGPFSFNIRGQITGWDGTTGAMDFQFTAVDILLLGKQIWQVTPKTKPKTYTFYFEDQGIAAARSSAGGLALLRK